MKKMIEPDAGKIYFKIPSTKISNLQESDSKVFIVIIKLLQIQMFKKIKRFNYVK